MVPRNELFVEIRCEAFRRVYRTGVTRMLRVRDVLTRSLPLRRSVTCPKPIPHMSVRSLGGLGMFVRRALALVCLTAMTAGAPVLWAQEPTAAPAPPAEQGTLVGTVLDKTTGDPLIQANVEVVGQAKRVETDMDGHFTLKLAPGTYELRISAPLYQPVKVTGVKVKANDVSKQSVSLAAATANVEVVEVTAKANKAAEAAQLV